MEQSEEVEDVVYDFAANMRYITWKPKQLATLLGDPSYTGPRAWCNGTVYAPLDVAQAVADFAAFIVEHPLPHVPTLPRVPQPNKMLQLARGKLLRHYMRAIRLEHTQVAYHCYVQNYHVRSWCAGQTIFNPQITDVLCLWVDYIQAHPFPQYRKGTHGGARYQHSPRPVACSAKQSRMTPS